MHVLIAGTYESGHQPLHVATAAALLRGAGHDVSVADLSVGPIDRTMLAAAEALAIAVPMHTAMRLAVDLARRARSENPDLPICLFGLYAAVGAGEIVGTVVDRAIAGEYCDDLIEWVAGLSSGSTRGGDPLTLSTRRASTPLPDRSMLPALERYGSVIIDSDRRHVGYVETSRGCSYRCRHCPVPTIYDGRIRVVDAGTVLSDIAQLVDAGARHITFGDPDFLNGVHHSLRIVSEMHSRFPGLTFDITTKVEHILRYGDIWPGLSESGLGFVISAFETTNDRILGLLDKGHTASDMADAVHHLRRHGIEIRPTWMPFTPWTEVSDLVDIADFITIHDLIDNVDPVQLSIRLLIPDGSLMLELPELAPHLGSRDAAALGYHWAAADPGADTLHRALAIIATRGAETGEDTLRTLQLMWSAIAEAAGIPPIAIPSGATTGRPRSTEPWFC